MFSDLLENSNTKNLLSSALTQNNIVQTLLFTGAVGSGKFTLAKIVAMGILCRDDTGNKPCNVCNSCNKCQKLVHPDLDIIDFEGREITVATARKIRQDSFVMPNDGDKRVFIIRDIQNLNRNSANALLKTLEEPPSHVHFILTCDNVKSILPTILSRCTVYSLDPLSADTIKSELTRRFPEKSQEELNLATTFSNGILGCAIKFFDENNSDEIVLSIIKALSSRNEFALYEACASAEKLSREEFTAFLYNLRKFLRDALLLSANIKHETKYKSQLSDIAFSLDDNELVRIFDLCLELIQNCKQNVSISLLCACLCSKSFTANV